MTVQRLFDGLIAFARNARKGAVGRAFFDFLQRTGITPLLTRPFELLILKRNQKNPTEKMLNSREYFGAHKDELEYVLGMLSDERSKDCYKALIDFRCCSVYKDLAYEPIDRQYWYNDYFKYSDDERLVDCGAYIGDSIMALLECMKERGGALTKAVAFEPDGENIKKLVRNVKEAVVMPYCVLDKSCEVSFAACGEGDSRLDDGAGFMDASVTRVQAVALDEIPECADATIIKMDIEGAEVPALKGAERLIKTNKPKLAVCIYHKDSDMIEVPLLIHKMVPEYKLYAEHYGRDGYGDSVLYAVPPEQN